MIPFKEASAREISPETMSNIYEILRTPYKYGAILKYDSDLCDSPCVFRYGDRWYMSHIKISKDTAVSGYTSYLSQGDSLTSFADGRMIFDRSGEERWDSRQIACYAGFIDNELFGSYEIRPVNGKYYFPYLGGNLDGYETDPLMMGLAYTETPSKPGSYRRLAEPIMRPDDIDARAGEQLTLYKSYMWHDAPLSTGYPYVNAYNAKSADQKESIFLAVSRDGVYWERYGDRAVLRDDTPEQNIRICGDPVVLHHGELYIMVYFVLRDGVTYDTFACSYDLVHWTRWQGEPLVQCEFDWEDVYAHKPSIVIRDGVVYHYYCAVSSRGERFIALATSRDLKA